MVNIDLLIKKNPKQGIAELEKQLNTNFKNNYSKLRKIYESNRGTDEFIQLFIQSNILETHFKTLLLDYKNLKKDKKKDSFFSNFLSDYFNQDKYINIRFLKQFKEEYLSLFQYFFYKYRVYKSPKHIQSLKKVFSVHDKFLELTLFLNKIHLDLSYKEKEVKKILKKINFFDLLCITQYFTNTQSIMELKKYNLVGPKILDEVASKILNYKIELDDKEYKIDEETFAIKIGKTIEISDSKRKKNKQIMNILFGHFKKVMHLEDLIDSLRFEQYNYNFLNLNTLKLFPKTELDYLEYKKVNHKLMFKDGLLNSFIKEDFSKIEGVKNIDSLNKQTEINILQSTHSITELLGNKIPLNNQEVSFHNIIWVLSKLAERNKRMFANELDINLVDLPIDKAMKKTQFENMMLKNNTWNFLNMRSQKFLVETSMEELKRQLNVSITKQQVISIFDFFSTDINSKNNKEINLLKKPFIKNGDKYIWGYSSLKFKDLSKILTMNIFANPQIKENFIKKKADKFEEKISDLFKLAEFKSTFKVTPKKSEQHDIDVVAYKDGYLFVVETKITYFRSTYTEIQLHTEGALKKAEEQLKLRIKDIDKYMNNIKTKLGIKKAEIKKIIPLIITNSFEGISVRENGMFKLSEYELESYLQYKSPESLLKMIKMDYYWEAIKEKEEKLVVETNKFNNLEVKHYV